MAHDNNQIASGIEKDPDGSAEVQADCVVDTPKILSVVEQHLRLIQVRLVDQTDHYNELVHERSWLLHTSEREISLKGNLFVIENLAAGGGHILVKKAPLPWSRPVPAAFDLRITLRQGGGFDFKLMESAGDRAESWDILEYRGGMRERTQALHAWQQRQRPRTDNHAEPHFLTNTWGDRSRDSRIRADFIALEIDAAHRLGADIVQIDDGWQRGVTSNSAYAKQYGGVWDGFWNADPNFWEPHPERFSEGLMPTVERARAKGMNIGLWFAPDSWNDFANWQKDADCILGLFKKFGVEHFKIDGVNAKTELAFGNLRRFFQTVLEGSQGRVVFDLDITAASRPGYFGAMEVGPLFVENRYTDWHNYWPHQTLRNLWKLSRWVDPRRLRFEFLNNERNADKYLDDPLAPARYSARTLFATVMFSNPLGWFETSNLPDGYHESVAELVRIWKLHREALFGGSICPIGEEPDGFSYTGFLSYAESSASGYVLVFRELHPEAEYHLRLPALDLGACKWEILASEGAGRIASQGDTLQVSLAVPLGFIFARFTCG